MRRTINADTAAHTRSSVEAEQQQAALGTSLPGADHFRRYRSETGRQPPVLCGTATGPPRPPGTGTLSSGFPGRVVPDSASRESICEDVWDDGPAPLSGVAWAPPSSAPTGSNTQVLAAEFPYPSTQPCVHPTFLEFSLCEIMLRSPCLSLLSVHTQPRMCARMEATPLLPESVVPSGVSLRGCTGTHMQALQALACILCSQQAHTQTNTNCGSCTQTPPDQQEKNGKVATSMQHGVRGQAWRIVEAGVCVTTGNSEPSQTQTEKSQLNHTLQTGRVGALRHQRLLHVPSLRVTRVFQGLPHPVRSVCAGELACHAASRQEKHTLARAHSQC